ncbi:MAG: hypothetical protein WC606_00155 [Candidatus Absconditabacterales bacterium]
MYLDNPELQKQMAEETKKKWEKLVFGDKPYKCGKCGRLKDPKDFVIQRLDNYWVGKYRYLYECKECKKNRIYQKRDKDRETIEGALQIIVKQLQQGAKNRKLGFSISSEDLLDLREKQQGKCYYTGYDMEYGCIHYKEGKESDKTKWQLSCDRLDNNRGYEKGNIVLCCTIANKMKNTFSQKEFYKICGDISAKHN